MKCFFHSQSINPYFNLALEEYLFQNKANDYFIIYVNEPSVVCGKHQNPYKECNIEFVESNGINICRRFSGGGTVFHDAGNLNFCFIESNFNSKGMNIDFKKYTIPVLEFLREAEINASINSRNNILIENKKISGNAEHIAAKRTLHHGTLLFDSNLEMLTDVFAVDTKKYYDKSVQSVTAEVTNIKKHIETFSDIHHFSSQLGKFMMSHYGFVPLELETNDIEKINTLAQTKFRSNEWIYQYSPKYSLKRNIGFSQTEIQINVDKGIIQSFFVSGEDKIIHHISQSATGLAHQTTIFRKIFSDIETTRSIKLSEYGIDIYSFF